MQNFEMEKKQFWYIDSYRENEQIFIKDENAVYAQRIKYLWKNLKIIHIDFGRFPFFYDNKKSVINMYYSTFEKA